MPDGLNLNTVKIQSRGCFFQQKVQKVYFQVWIQMGNKIYNNFDQFQYDAGMYYHVTDDKKCSVGIEYQVLYDQTHKNHPVDFWVPKDTKLQW